jgi:hypothetical protein
MKGGIFLGKMPLGSYGSGIQQFWIRCGQELSFISRVLPALFDVSLDTGRLVDAGRPKSECIGGQASIDR